MAKWIDEMEADRLERLHHFERDQFDRFLEKLSSEAHTDPGRTLTLIGYALDNTFNEWVWFQNAKESKWHSHWRPVDLIVDGRGWLLPEFTQFIAENCTRLYMRRINHRDLFPTALNWLAKNLVYNHPENRE